ncbi:DUF4403 family protein [Ekhidna sp.]|uniref:DUF4403 family protein n=1 Tax=Ekhidna sp. TaxID=2608089 RepID=UPI003CCBF2A8
MKNWLFVLCLFVLWSCQKKRTEQSAEVVVDTEVQKINRIKTSELTFPLDFPLSELSKLFNEVLPEVLVDDTLQLKKEDEFIKIKIEPIGQMLLASYGNNLDASIPMKVTAAIEKRLIGIKTHQSIDFEVRVDMNTQLFIEEDWNLGTKCTIQKIHWIEPPVLEVFGIKVNLQNKIDKKLLEKSDDIETKICHALQGLVPLKEQVEKIWTIISSAHRIGKKPIDIWLTSNPSFFSAHFSKDVVDTLRVIIHTKSEIFITPLEGLEYEERPMPVNAFVETEEDNALNISVDVYIPYEKMEEVIKDRLDSTTFSYEGASILLTNFSTNTKEGKLHLTFDVVGDVSATIDAYAYPFLDAEKNLIIDSIEYNIQSESSLVYLAEWIASDKLTEFLKSNSKISLSKTLDSLDAKIIKALNKSNLGRKVDLEISFDKIESDTLVFTREGLQWFFDVKGNAHAFLTKEIINKQER